jgi:hypothetical protein
VQSCQSKLHIRRRDERFNARRPRSRQQSVAAMGLAIHMLRCRYIPNHGGPIVGTVLRNVVVEIKMEREGRKRLVDEHARCRHDDYAAGLRAAIGRPVANTIRQGARRQLLDSR